MKFYITTTVGDIKWKQIWTDNGYLSAQLARQKDKDSFNKRQNMSSNAFANSIWYNINSKHNYKIIGKSSIKRKLSLNIYEIKILKLEFHLN